MSLRSDRATGYPMRTFAAAAAPMVAALVSVARADDPPLLANGDEALAHAFSLDLQYARVNGFVQVRETTREGTRLPLQDLGLDSAEAFSLGLDQRLGDDSRLSWRARWYYAAGSASFDHEVVFNAVSYEADST